MPAYLYILVGSLAFPLIRSFEPRVHYIGNWKKLFTAFTLTAIFFIIWDVIFTKNGVWGFNPDYLVGFSLINLPVEEWMFFFVIPYCSVFIYECVNYFLKKDFNPIYGWTLAGIMGSSLILLAFFNLSRSYTFWNFLFTGVFLMLHALWWKKTYMGRFFLAYLLHLIPFLMVNGILTGTLVTEPIVWYNNEENLSIRIGTIPIEDTIYALLLLLMNITIYERLKGT